jgi:hypothetical protein
VAQAAAVAATTTLKGSRQGLVALALLVKEAQAEMVKTVEALPNLAGVAVALARREHRLLGQLLALVVQARLG